MAGNTRKISEIVDIPAAKKQVDELIGMIEKIKKEVTSMPLIYGDIKNGSGSLANQLKDIENMRIKQNELVTATQDLNKANQKRIDMDHALQVEAAKQKIVSENNKKAIKEEAKEALNLNDAYSKLNKEYIEAQRNAKNLAAAHGTTNKAAQEAAKHAKGLSDELKKIDNTVGQNQRNVGNYRESLNGLFTKVSPEASEATSKITQMGGALSKLGPYGAIIAAGIMIAGSALAAFYMGTQEGIDRLKVRTAGFSGSIGVLKGELAKVGKGIDEAFGGESENKIFTWGNTFKIIGYTLMLNTKWVDETASKMDEAGNIAKRIAREQIALEKEENDLIVKRANANNILIAAREAATDETKTLQEKKDIYVESFAVEKEIAKEDVNSAIKKSGILKQQLDLMIMQGALTKESMKDSEKYKEYQESLANVINIQSEADKKTIKGKKAVANFDKEMRTEEMELSIAYAKQNEAINTESSKKILANERSTLAQKIYAERSNLNESIHLIELERHAKIQAAGPGADETKIGTINQESITEKFKVQSETESRIFKMQQDYQKRDIIASEAIAKSKLDMEKDALNNRLEIDKAGYEQIMSLNTRLEISQKLTNLNIQEENTAFAKQKTTAYGKTALELQAMDEEHERKITLITSKGELERFNIHKQFATQQISDLQKGSTNEQIGQLTQYNEQMGSLHGHLQNGTMSLGQFTQAKEKLSNSTAIAGIDTQLVEVRKAQGIAIEQNDFDTAQRFAKQEQDLIKQKGELQLQQFEKDEKRKQELIQKTAKISEQTVELIGKFANRNIESEIKGNEIQLSNIEARSAAEEKAVEDSTMTEQQKSSTMSKIRLNEQKEKDLIEAKNRALKQNEAENDKKMSIFKAIMNTAVAVSSALAETPIYAAIIGALGAAEIAFIASTPIPKYASGRSGGRGEFAMVDEKGAELRIRRSGEMIMGSNAGANLQYLQPGERVIPHDKILNFALNGLIPSQIDLTSKKLDELIQSSYQQTQRLETAIKGSKSKINIINKIDLNSSQWINQNIKD